MKNSIEFTKSVYQRFGQELVHNLDDLQQYRIGEEYDFRSAYDSKKPSTMRINPCPYFLTEDDNQTLNNLSKQLAAILEKITEAFVNKEPLVYDYYPQYQRYLPYFYQVNNRWLTKSRYDFAVTATGEILFTEFNTSSPGGSLLCGIGNQMADDYCKAQANYFQFDRVLQPYEHRNAFVNYLLRLVVHI